MKSFDAFGRPIQEFQVKTSVGGYLSVFSIVCISALFIQELRYFLEWETKDEMVIDQNQDQKYFNISLDITFPKVPCSILQVNLIDQKKANIMHVSHEIYKTRLSSSQSPLGRRIRDGLSNVAQTSAELADAGNKESSVRTSHSTPHLRCGSCYQSHIDEDDCCASCEDVRKSFSDRGWNDRPDYVFAQCLDEAYGPQPPQATEGCRVEASLHVRKVAATIHVGVGRFFKRELVPAADLKEFVSALDFSHDIQGLAFGPDFPGLVKVLDGRKKSAHTDQLSEHWQYDIHVIPTRYQDEGADEIVSHQYSVTEYVKTIDQRSRHQELTAIGMWTNYDFTPFEVKVTRSRKSLLHFFTVCCASLGGIFAFTGMLDNFVYQINNGGLGRPRSRGALPSSGRHADN